MTNAKNNFQGGFRSVIETMIMLSVSDQLFVSRRAGVHEQRGARRGTCVGRHVWCLGAGAYRCVPIAIGIRGAFSFVTFLSPAPMSLSGAAKEK